MASLSYITQHNVNVYDNSDDTNKKWAVIRDSKKRIDSIKKTSLFNGLTTKQYIELLNISNETTLPKYEIIFHQGDKSDSLYILKKGHIKIYINEHFFVDMSAINIFGEFGFFYNSPRLYSVITADDSTIIEITKTRLLRLFKNDNYLCNCILLNIINEFAHNHQKYIQIINSCKMWEESV